MKLSRKAIIPVFLSVFASVMFAYTSFTPGQKLRIAAETVAKFYVDTVNEDKLVEDAIRGMLDNLDPHSSYTNAEETQELNEPLQGSFTGIGITFNMTTDTLYVVQTVSGGPSDKVGILAGDRIIAVNDTSIAGMKLKNSQIIKKLRGPKDTKVNLQILRKSYKGKSDTIDFVVTRDVIPLYSVDAAYMAAPEVGYIRLNKFAADTYEEFSKAVKDLKKEGMKDLILDLTDNGGGYLNSAVDIAGEILDPRSMVVFTEGLSSPHYEHLARPSGREPMLKDGRVVVMMNQYSASASEITAGAIQDWDKGVIVGRRSFGKGLVQRPIPFPDGSMIRLTIAHYYTPTGRDIQKPFTPGDKEKYRKDLDDRFTSGELMHADSIKYVDSLKVHTIKLNRPIYGGGGIYPDVFVPLDTTEYTNYYRDVQAKGLLNRFAINYIDGKRKQLLKTYKNENHFVEEFELTDDDLQLLYDMAAEEEIEFNEEQALLSRNLFLDVLKALIGRDIFENQTYFKIFNKRNPIFIEALDVIQSDRYNEILSEYVETNLPEEEDTEIEIDTEEEDINPENTEK